ncbi:MAG: DUF4331 family protein [Myxococcales bacterium]|nr:DUF4331 family protein [Myxococcales bacterium]MCB9736439.1 DUF4331 family protein [Deltaproteobacteria bacterium]
MRRTILALSTLALSLGAPTAALAADHLDAPATVADPTADINDVYVWQNGAKTVFVMTVFPAASADAKFSDAVQYVFHTASGASYGAASNKTDIICTFDAAQMVTCWVGADGDYVTGDASGAAGLTSTSGKTKVFAGLRDDPFFFNLAGFQAAVAAVVNVAGGLTFDAAKCPTVSAEVSAAVVGLLGSDGEGGAGMDFFAPLNTLALVVEVDKSLVTAGGPVVAVWGATRTTASN